MKKMKLKSIVYLLFTSLSLGLISCGGDDNHSDDLVVTDSTKVDSTSLKNEIGEEIIYQVPSPSEMLTFVKMVGGKANKNSTFLNSADNASKYNDSKSKAINFGIYGCDLSYCSTFSMGVEALKYFKVVKKLGDEVGVSTTIDVNVAKRLENNVGNPDSLAFISDDLYYSSFEDLQKGKQGSTLALMVAGGYIESLYIVTNLNKFDAKNQATQRIADQKYTLDNIIEFMKKYESDASVAEVIKDFNSLKADYDTLKETEVAAQASSKGIKVLEGGTVIEITQDQYNVICDKIKSIRNSYTLTK
jgi:hypothetical protein